jgi:DNA polymerase-3 subunit alpha
MENFVNLHVHGVHSLYDAINTPEEIVQKTVELNQPGVALTDHGSLGGILRLKNAALKAGIKPITGIENYCVENLIEEDNKGKRIKQKNAHVILLAKNLKGYKNILHLNYLANKDVEHYYYKPRNIFDELFKYHSGIVVGTACIASGFANYLKRDMPYEAEKLFKKFVEVFKDDLFAELQINEIEEQKHYNKWLINQANKYGVPIVLTADAHYINPDGAEIQEFSFALRKDDDKEVGEEFQCHHLYLHNINDFKKLNALFDYGYSDYQIDMWCKNSIDVMNKIDFIIPERNKMILPRQAFDEDDRLMELVRQGMCEHFNVDDYKKVPKEYRERIRTELDIIIRKGVSRYFLILWDIFQFIKKEKISTGVSRGCFLPDNKVRILNNFVCIKDVKKGDKILTGFNKESYVNEVFKYDINEEISEITTEENKIISSTQDHKFLVVKNGLPLKIENAEWVEAKNIDIDDCLVKF